MEFCMYIRIHIARFRTVAFEDTEFGIWASPKDYLIVLEPATNSIFCIYKKIIREDEMW